MKSLYILSDSTGVGQYVTIHKTWPVLLSQHLEGRYIVQNASRNGETSRQALERLYNDVLQFEPDLVYVQYGSNDANKWETDRGDPRCTVGELQTNILSILRRCCTFHAVSILGSNHTGAYNEAIAEISQAPFLYVDHSQYTGSYLMHDGIHLNEYGHQLYFENIAKVIP